MEPGPSPDPRLTCGLLEPHSQVIDDCCGHSRPCLPILASQISHLPGEGEQEPVNPGPWETPSDKLKQRRGCPHLPSTMAALRLAGSTLFCSFRPRPRCPDTNYNDPVSYKTVKLLPPEVVTG